MIDARKLAERDRRGRFILGWNKLEDGLRFWSKVAIGKDDECWEWKAGKSEGYGNFRYGGQAERAHRVAYKLTYGAIPKNKYVLHTCDNPPCCNPAHLTADTQRINMQQAIERGLWDPAHSNHRKAAAHPNSRLQEVEVLEIRRLFKTGQFSQHLLAKMFEITQPNIGYIVRREAWRHI